MKPKTSPLIKNLLARCQQVFTAAQLSPTSRKLYLLDIKNFLNFLEKKSLLTISVLSRESSYRSYLQHLKASSSPATFSRTLSALRQFGVVIANTYSVGNPTDSLVSSGNPARAFAAGFPLFKYIKYFTNHLRAIHLSDLTIKSYKSDIDQYLHWGVANRLSNNITQLLTEKNIQKYLDHLTKSTNIALSTIERKRASLTRFQAWYQTAYGAAKQTDNNFKQPSFSDFAPLQPTFAPPSPPKPSYLRPLVSFSLMAILLSTLFYYGYRQFSRENVRLTQAVFPSTPTSPNRELSFQGRLENAAGAPITTTSNLIFKLFDADSGGTELYSSGTCSLTPDEDGIFTTQIGGTCGPAVGGTVFTENVNVYLEVTVGSETLAPRQHISTVPYALNSETIQGFPISATISALKNTIVPMNQWGEIVIGEQSPRLTAVSGTFQISAPALSLVTATGTSGNISLAPDGTGQINAVGNTTTTNFFNVSDAQLTTGSLLTGTVSNANTGFKLLDLLAGTSPTSKFSVTATGSATLAGDLTIYGDDLFMATNTSGYILVADGTNFNPVAMVGDVTINSTGGTTIGSNKVTEDKLKLVNAATDEYCLTYESTDGDFEWQSCGSGGDGSSNWRIGSGAISPINDTLDLLVGSSATSSAKFAVLNVSSGTPTASVSAGTSGATFLTADGYLSATQRQNLTLGNSASYNTTGSILLNPNGTGNVGAGTTSPDARIDSLATSGEQLRLTYTDGSVYSAFTLDSSGNLTIDNTGTKTVVADDLQISGDDLIMATNTSGYLLVADGTNFNPVAISGDITIDGSGVTAIGADKVTEATLKSVNAATDEYCLTYESTVGDFEWQSCGAGGSGSSNWRINAGALSPINDTLDLLVGSTATSSAKFAVLNVNPDAAGTPTASVSAGTSGAAYLTAAGNLATTQMQNLTLGGSTTGSILFQANGDTDDYLSLTTESNVPTIRTAGTSNLIIAPDGGNTSITGSLTLSTASNLIIGTTTLAETTAANDSGAFLVGTFDEFDNSSSANVQDVLDDLDAGLTTALSSGGPWVEGAGILYPKNSTVDLLVGGTASSSAKFAALNMNSGTPTASLSAGTSGGTYLTAAGLLATTNSQVLTLGDASTGDINFYSASNKLDSSGNLTLAGDLTLSGGNLNTGDIALVLGDATTDSITLTTDGTGDGEIVLPNDSIGPNEIWTTGQTDEYCLTYESTGTTWEWQSCSGGASGWTDGGTYLYPTSGETLGDSTSAGANKLAGIYLADSAPLVFGTDNDISLSYDGTTFLTTLGSNTWNIDSNTLVVDGTNNKVGIGNATPTGKFHVTGAVVGKALAIFDETGDQDIIVASASGDTRFRVARDGDILASRFVDIAGNSYEGAGSELFYLDPAATDTSLMVDGNLISDGAFSLTSNGTNGDITINAGTGTVSLASNLSGSGTASFTVDNATNDNITNVLTLSHTTSGTPTAASSNFSPDQANSLGNNLVAYYKMDESSGTRTDSAGSNDLTAFGTGGVTDSPAGKKSAAADFEITESDYLRAYPSTTLSPSSNGFTVAGWFQLESEPATFMGLVSRYTAATAYSTQWEMWWSPSNQKFNFAVYRQSNGAVLTTVTADTLGATATNTWYFIVAWYDPVANTISIQVNNGTPDSIAVNNTNIGEVADQANSVMTIGGDTGGSTGFFDGLIDELGIWQRVLTTQEKSDLYNSASANTCTDDCNNPTTTTTGIGTGILLRSEDASGNAEDQARISSLFNTATSGTETSSLLFETRSAGSALARTMRLDGPGNLTTAGSIFSSGSPDIAENIRVTDESIGPGDIVMLDSTYVNSDPSDIYNRGAVKKADLPYTNQQIGVISSDPGIVINADSSSLTTGVISTDHERPLVLAGRVPVKVSTMNGPISIGDPITASTNPGVGMKATLPGTIIGKAMEPFQCDTVDQVCTGTVLTFINPSWHEPDVIFNSSGELVLRSTGELVRPFALTDSVGNMLANTAAYAKAVIADLRAGLTQTNELQTDLISPLASGSAITIAAPVTITSRDSSEPLLLVEGEVSATTISARLAQLDVIKTEKLYADEIVAGKITAGEIVGLDARIASLSAGNTTAISDSELESITDRIKSRIAALTGNTPMAGDLPVPTGSSDPANLTDLPNPTNTADLIASDSATLASLDANFATINDYLAVIGQATITNLDVTGNFFTENIASKTDLLAIQPLGGTVSLAANTLIVDSTGQVAINGDLTVSGRILADSAGLNSLSLGSSPSSPSALGQLLAIYNEQGQAVATIDASGSANLAGLTTKLITIASAGQSTPSGLLSTTTSSNATAGEGLLVSPKTELTIESPYITPNSLVYLTPTTNTDNKVLFVKAKSGKSFTVAIDSPANSDISFNWWIIELSP